MMQLEAWQIQFPSCALIICKKETNKGEFLLLLLFLTQFLSNVAEEIDPFPDQEEEEITDNTDPELKRLEGEKIYFGSDNV